MYSNNIAKHLIDDIETYRRRNYNAELKLNIYLHDNVSYYFRIHDVFQIVDMEFLGIEETKDGVPLKTMIRIDDIMSYDFCFNDDAEE